MIFCKRKHVSWLTAAYLLLLGSTIADDIVNNDIHQPQDPVAYSRRSFVIRGKRILLFSGSIHYTRVPPSDWDNVFRMAKVSMCESVYHLLIIIPVDFTCKEHG